jgi:hypothetical protein
MNVIYILKKRKNKGCYLTPNMKKRNIVPSAFFEAVPALIMISVFPNPRIKDDLIV